MRSEKRKDMYADRYHAGAKGQKHCHYAKHRKTNSIRRFVTGIAALVMVMSLSFGFGSFFSSAHDSKAEEPSGERYYKSVQLEKGDSLWSIAQRYRRTEDSIYEYMDELAEANHLSLKTGIISRKETIWLFRIMEMILFIKDHLCCQVAANNLPDSTLYTLYFL